MLEKTLQTKKEECDFCFYQHCLLLNESPNVVVDDQMIKDALKKSNAWFARYITEFDISENTEWWYCLKDDKYDISLFKAKARYEINKGRKNFYVNKINAFEYDEDIYIIDVKKFEEYPVAYRPEIKKNGDKYLTSERVKKSDIWFGLFDINNGKLSGYAVVKETEFGCVNLNVVAILPETYKRNSSAALVDGILTYYQNKAEKHYICDGSRNIKHITNYQDFLISTFGFRRAYCRLKIIYKWWMKIAVVMIKPFKNLLLKSDRPLFYSMGSLLKMDEYARLSQRRK